MYKKLTVSEFDRLPESEREGRIRYGIRFKEILTEIGCQTDSQFLRLLLDHHDLRYDKTSISLIGKGRMSAPLSITSILSNNYNINIEYLENGKGTLHSAFRDLTVTERLKQLEEKVAAFSSLNDELQKTIRGMRVEMNELKQGIAKLTSSKNKTNVGPK